MKRITMIAWSDGKVFCGPLRLRADGTASCFRDQFLRHEHRRQSIGVHSVRTPQFLALWCPPICGHPRIFDHLIVNYMLLCFVVVKINYWLEVSDFAPYCRV